MNSKDAEIIRSFVINRNRMCGSFKDCDMCPLSEDDCGLTSNSGEKELNVIIRAVSKWTDNKGKNRMKEPKKNLGDERGVKMKPTTDKNTNTAYNE